MFSSHFSALTNPRHVRPLGPLGALGGLAFLAVEVVAGVAAVALIVGLGGKNVATPSKLGIFVDLMLKQKPGK